MAAGLPAETVEDVDASLETLTNAIQDALRVAAPDEDRSHPVPPFILAKIREKKWPRRTWLVARDPAINQLQRQIGCHTRVVEDDQTANEDRRSESALASSSGSVYSDLEKSEALGIVVPLKDDP